MLRRASDISVGDSFIGGGVDAGDSRDVGFLLGAFATVDGLRRQVDGVCGCVA